MQIPLQLAAGIRHFKRAFLGPGTLKSEAVCLDILCPEEKVELNPVIYLPGQLEKVTGGPPESTAEAEIHAITRREAIHASTIAYHIRDAALFGGSVYAGRFRHFIYQAPSRSTGTRPKQIERAALTSTFIGSKYFAHWLKEDCTQYLLSESFGDPLCMRAPTYPDAAKYAEYFRQNWSASTYQARVGRLVIFQDFGQNSHKRQRYEILRSRVKEQFGSDDATSLVYLRRGQTGSSRLIQNEPEIIDALVKRGFLIADISSDGLEQILTVLSRAKLVVSIEGSHCGHCVVSLPRGSGLIVLEPPDRFTGNQRGWADCLSIRSGLVVGDAAGSQSHFSIADILNTVDLMMREL